MPRSKTSLNEILFDIRRIENHRATLTERKIKAIYKSLMKDLRVFLSENYEKYSDKDGRLFLSYLDAQNKRAAFLQEIVKNVDNISPQLKKEMMSLVKETYAESYKGMTEAIKKAEFSGNLAEVTKDLTIPADVLKEAANNNISKLTLPHVMEKHRQEIIYQIQQVLFVGLTNGDRYDQMAKNINEILVGNGHTSKGALGKSLNITRTESHRNVETGFMDAAERIQDGMEGSDYIYAATWETMKDERVRPQRRVKTKKGWKTYKSKNSANHQKMQGVTVKAGELFELESGVKAKEPGSIELPARHACNCRCFLSYDLLTVEEFAERTNQTPEQVRKKYNMK